MDVPEFSLECIKSIEDELSKSLFQTYKVKRVEDIALSMLNKSIKDVLIRLVTTLSGALSRSQVLLKDAAIKVDNFKTQQINHQKALLDANQELLSMKNEQLTIVKDTVATEMRSWSEVVKKNCEKSGSTVTPRKIKEAVKSAVSEEDRLNNVMLFGLKELEEEDDVHDAEDEGMVDEIVQELNVSPSLIQEIQRVGERRDGFIRPMKVRMSRKDCVLELLARARRLKDTEKYSSVFLAPDRTREERSAHKEHVEALKKRREEFPDRVFYLRGDKICEKARNAAPS